MQLEDTAAEADFREKVRTWVTSTLPGLGPEPDPEDWPGRREYDTRWQRLQHDAGFAGIDWPARYGGRGGTAVEQLIYLEECARAGAPYGAANFVGLKHAGPTVFTHGTPEQCERFLPPILRGDQVWCQGFSEPGAGSDLAAVRTRAVREGDEYVVDGQKIWTSHAPVADLCEMLVRTGPTDPPHRGLTFLVVPMDAPGLETRPLRTITGSADFAEVFLEGVRVPVANRIGAENAGWSVAMATLAFERGATFVGELFNAMGVAGELAEVLGRARPGVSSFEVAAARHELGWLSAELDGLWALLRHTVSGAGAGEPPGTGASLFKLRFTELQTELTDLVGRTLGRAALATDGLGDPRTAHHVEERLRATSLTVAGGTSQIQRNIIAERILGLPKG